MPTIILTGAAGYSEPTGTWGVSGQQHFTNAGPATAQFAFTGLTPGTPYVLALAWVEGGNRVVNTAWSVSGTAGSPSGTIDQTLHPDSFTTGGENYLYLPVTFTPTGTTLTLTISYPASPSPPGNYVAVDGAWLDLASNVSVNPIPTVQGGDWAAASTWLFGTIPSGATFATVKHAVTVSADATVGDGTAATVLAITPGHTLTIAGCKLTIRGNASVSNNTATAVAESIVIQSTPGHPAGIELDGNAGVGPVLTWDFSSLLHMIGTTSDRCFIRTKVGTAGNPASMALAPGAVAALNFDCIHSDFTDLGSSALDAWDASLTDATLPAGWTRAPAVLTDCTFTDCGVVLVVVQDGTVDLRITGSTFSSAISGAGGHALLRVDCETAALSTGNRTVSGSFFYGQTCGEFKPRDMTITGNYFDSCPRSEGQCHFSTAFTGNFIRKDSSVVTGWSGGMDGNYLLAVAGATGTFLLNGMDALGGAATISNNVCQNIGSACATFFGDTEGTADLTTASNDTLTVAGNLVIPPQGGTSTGLYFCNSNISFPRSNFEIFTHNTVCTASGSPFSPGPTTGLKADTITAMKSNIFANTGTSAGVYAFQVGDQSIVQLDAMPAANATNNAWTGLDVLPPGQWSATSGDTDVEAGTIYWLPMGGATHPGANDVHADPMFVHPTRDLLTWGQQVHGTDGSLSAALALLRADPTLTASDLIPWVRAGFAPTNVALRGAAHDGTDIGAVAFPSAVISTHSFMTLGVGS